MYFTSGFSVKELPHSILEHEICGHRVLPLVERIGNVSIAKESLLPSLEERNCVWKKPKAVIGREHRDAQHVPHRDKHEEIFHVHSKS